MSLVKRQKTEAELEGIVLEGHNGSVLSVKFSPSGSSIATLGIDKSIMFWSLSTDEADNYGTLPNAHKSAVTSIAWVDETQVASSGMDGTVGLWDLSTGVKTSKFKCSGPVNEVGVHENTIVGVDDEGRTSIWDVRTRDTIKIIDTEYPVLTCTMDSHRLYTSGIDPSIYVYDVRKIDDTPITFTPGSSSVTSLALNKDGLLLSRSMDGNVFVHDANNQSFVRLYPTGTPDETQLIRACFSNDGVSIFTGSGNSVAVFEQSVARRILDHRGRVLSVDYHPTENLLSSTSMDGTTIVRRI